jgi:signal transduction histidine kinase
VLDCALVYVVLVNYHGFLHNAYYDAVYLLFVVAGTATHGRRGAWFLSGVAGLAVLGTRLQLIATGAFPYELRHLTDAAFYAIFFLITSSAVAFLINLTAEIVSRRERAWHAELSARHADLQRTAAELAEAIQLRDAMLTGVTHDLRTPLTVIKLQAQLVRRRADARFAVSIDHIERAANRMARWIEELLEIATVHSADELHLNLDQTDLLALVRDVIEEHAQNGTCHRIELHADDLSIVGQFDAPRLERVVDNLLGNAIKYSPSGGCVRIDIHATVDQVTIAVRDQGLGIPAEDLPHIFEAFRRGTNVVGINGTGIGLASTQRIVHGHGGTIDVQSTAGQGSTFTIRLPLVHAPDQVGRSGARGGAR